MRRLILTAVVAFISTAPIVAAVLQQVVSPAEAEQQLAQTTSTTPSTAEPTASIARSVIAGQIEAFRHDDGTAAYAYAAPNIRRVFPTADQFLAMVKSAYAPVYRPRSVNFGTLEKREGRWLQTVDLIGPDGNFYIATYSIEYQTDGSWKITGCTFITFPSTSAVRYPQPSSAFAVVSAV